MNDSIIDYGHWLLMLLIDYLMPLIRYIMTENANPPQCLQALLECTNVEKQPSGGMLSCLKGTHSRILAYTRVHSHDLFRLVF